MSSSSSTSQSGLFGDDVAPPPAGDGLVRLKVAKSGTTKLNSAQQRFNRLLARVENLERQVKDLESLATEVRAPHLERMAALRRQLNKAQADMLLFLHERLQHKGLSTAQQKSVRNMLRSLLESVDLDGDAEQWEALRDLYLSPQERGQDAQDLQEARKRVKETLGHVLGDAADLQDLDEFDSPEELLKAVMEKVQAHKAAEQERKAKRKARRAPTAKQRKIQAQEQDAKTVIRSIYRQLVSALHPDRESDPVEHKRKNALMGEANAAYKRGDLVTLLRLQLQTEQIDEASVATIADEKLDALSHLLKEQVAVLEHEVYVGEIRLSNELGIEIDAKMSGVAIRRWLEESRQEMAEMLEVMQSDLARVQDDAELKYWLREQAALAKQRERHEAMLMQFGPLY